jgi:Fe2+ or Zn2+ uptake regulation protein
MHIAAETLIDVLRTDGLRITRARTAVCEVLVRSHDEHLDAGDIRRRVIMSGGPNVDQSTVYRTLEVLENAGVLAHSHLGHGPAVYHLTEDASHQHFVCSECGRTVAVGSDKLAEWTGAIEAHTGFIVEPSHFALSGRCASCAAGAKP